VTRSKKDRTAIEQIEWMRNLLAFVLVGSFVSFAGVLLWKAIPEKNEQLLSYMLGQISGMALMALGFYFVNKVGQDALDAARTENTGKALEAIKETAKASGSGDAAEKAADQVAGAAVEEAEQVKNHGGEEL
jgi:hypothetical protein